MGDEECGNPSCKHLAKLSFPLSFGLAMLPARVGFPVGQLARGNTTARNREKVGQKMGLRQWWRGLWRQGTPDIRPTLDLHGLAVKEALRETEAFVFASYRAGISQVRIIYGKGLGSPGGKGVLREVVPKWCEKQGASWIEDFQREVDFKGGDGSLILYLKKPPSP